MIGAVPAELRPNRVSIYPSHSIEQTGPRSVRFTFNAENRELALLAGMRPILKPEEADHGIAEKK